jgi:hypothetical protein
LTRRWGRREDGLGVVEVVEEAGLGRGGRRERKAIELRRNPSVWWDDGQQQGRGTPKREKTLGRKKMSCRGVGQIVWPSGWPNPRSVVR